jgi:hypothetical protein
VVAAAREGEAVVPSGMMERRQWRHREWDRGCGRVRRGKERVFI